MPRVSGKTDIDNQLASIGTAIRVRRKGLSLSQEALADSSGVDRSHMGKIERGERNITYLNLARVALALNCKPSDILIDAGL